MRSAHMTSTWLWRLAYSMLCLSSAVIEAQRSGAPCAVPPGLQLGRTVDVSTEKDFYNALADSAVSIIMLVGDVQLAADTWGGDPLVVSRSILISGDTADYPSIDFSYLSKKCSLVANVTITFCRVLIRQTRYQLQSIAPGYDFFDKTEPAGARVVLIDCVSWYRACLPFNIAAVAAQNLKRPDLEPGVQSVSVETVQPFCRKNGPCWPNTGAQYNLAVEAQTTNSVGNYLPAGYALVTFDSLYICEVLMTTECIQTYGAGNCFTRTGSIPSPPPGVAGTQGNAAGSNQGNGLQQVNSAAGAVQAAAAAEQENSERASERTAIIAGSAAGAGAIVIAAAVGFAIWKYNLLPHGCWRPPLSVASKDSDVSDDKIMHDTGPGDPEAGLSPRSLGPGKVPDKECKGVHAALSTVDGAPAAALPHSTNKHGSLTLCSSEPRVSKSVGSSHHANGSLESDWARMDLFEDNPLTAVVMEQDPHLPNIRLDAAFVQEVRLIEGTERGTGSFGRVVEGLYRGVKVAVKMIHPAMLGNSARSIKTFRQEVDILGKCRHHNIVQLIGASLTPPHIFLVEELMACSLDTLVHDHSKPFPLEQVLLIARDIACGLAYLHPTIIHRDLKPANVLLDVSGTAKLTDFGLARLRDCTLVTKHPEAGTAPYVAPECFDTSNYTITDKADIYSFAVLLWEMLSRSYPWRGETPLAVAYKVTISKERLPLHVLDDQRCPRKLRKLIEECWDADPRRRPSAAVAAKQLTLVLQQLQAATGAVQDLGSGPAIGAFIMAQS